MHKCDWNWVFLTFYFMLNWSGFSFVSSWANLLWRNIKLELICSLHVQGCKHLISFRFMTEFVWKWAISRLQGIFTSTGKLNLESEGFHTAFVASKLFTTVERCWTVFLNSKYVNLGSGNTNMQNLPKMLNTLCFYLLLCKDLQPFSVSLTLKMAHLWVFGR